VEFLAGESANDLHSLGTLEPKADVKEGGALKEVFTLNGLSTTARYIEVRATNIGSIPSWHPASGRDAWLFADEIAVNPSSRSRSK
jgi:hypothetical protein